MGIVFNIMEQKFNITTKTQSNLITHQNSNMNLILNENTSMFN